VYKKIATRAGLVLIASILTLSVVEIGARIFVPDKIDAFFTPFEHDDRSYRITTTDPKYKDTLSWYTPGATGITGTEEVRINNLGLRDSLDYSATKPSNCYRILGIGDSMTFGKGVKEEETYLGVLEKRLKQRAGNRCIEVLNAGMPNTNFYIQWLHFVRHWWSFQPDHVLWGFFVYNDTQLQGEEEPYSMGWMEFVDKYSWLKGSALIRWAYYRAFFTMGARGMDEGLPRFYDPEYAGWKQFRKTVKKLRGFSNTEGIEVTFALIPMPVGYDEYPHSEYHTRLTKVLQEEEFKVLDLIYGLESIKARRHWVHPSDGHPDAFLHKQMAIYLEQHLPWAAWLKTLDPS